MISFIVAVGMHIACHCTQEEAESAASTLTAGEVAAGYHVFGVDDDGTIVVEIDDCGRYKPVGERKC